MHQNVGDHARPAPRVETDICVQVGVGLVPPEHGKPAVRHAISEQAHFLENVRALKPSEIAAIPPTSIMREFIGGQTL